MKIKLNKKELDYLLFSDFLSKKQDLLSDCLIQQKDNSIFLMISKDNADEIRDILGEQLQIIGFDVNYEITEEGKILENLIDKFYFN